MLPTLRSDEPSLEDLKRRREAIRRDLARIGDLRPGSLKAQYRRCGKSNCRCAREGEQGHGPSWFLSRIVKGKMHCQAIPVRALEETRQQVDECRRLRDLTRELIEVNERICHRRLRPDTPASAAKKRGSRPRSRRRSPPTSSG